MEKAIGINDKMMKGRRHSKRGGEEKVYNKAENLKYEKEMEVMRTKRESAEFQRLPEESYWNIPEQLRLFAKQRERIEDFNKLLSEKARLEKKLKKAMTKHPELVKKKLKPLSDRLRIMAKQLQPKHRRMYIEWN
jgi:Mg2+ and Co2+ transporter CorA